MAEWVFSLLTKDSIRRLCASITIILENFYTSYNHTDFGKKMLRNLGKFVGNIGNINFNIEMLARNLGNFESNLCHALSTTQSSRVVPKRVSEHNLQHAVLV